MTTATFADAVCFVYPCIDFVLLAFIIGFVGALCNYHEKLDGPEKERYKKVSISGFDPYETREYTKHTNQINRDGAR